MKHLLADKVVFEGQWYLPTCPEKKVSGTFTYTLSTGLTLKLLGSLEDLGDAKPRNTPHKTELILGDATGGNLITLQNCILTGRSWNLPSKVPNCRYIANEALVGIHLKSSENRVFSRVRISFSHLKEWVGIHGFETDFDLKSKTFKISYTLPDSIRIALQDGDELSISFGADGPTLTHPQIEASIKQHTSIELRSKAPMSVSEALEKTHPFTRFVSFVVGQPTNLEWIEPIADRSELVLGPPFTSDKIKASFLARFDRLSDNDPIFGGVPFHADQVKDTLQGLVRRWYLLYHKYRPCMDLYFGSVYNDALSPELRFLNLSFALETFHRRKNSGGEMPKDQHNTRVADILESAPTKWQDWLCKKLSSSNQQSFQERLRALIEQHSELCKQSLGDTDSFVGNVLTSRNYYVHYSSKKEKKACSGVGLLVLIYKLSTLLEACIANELGLPSTLLYRLLNRRIHEIKVLEKQLD